MYSVIAIGAVFSLLPAVFVALRFYTRLRITRFKVGVDDWLMLAAWVLCLGMGIMLIVGMLPKRRW
jgi:NO-binding membrane sensor protein with MHYT domain